MICIYDRFADDFSTNGIGTLEPSSCEVSETLNGEYEVKMVHPLDDDGKWQRIAQGRIIRVPVPASMTPKISEVVKEHSQQSYDAVIYKINAGRVRLRAGPSTSYQSLGTYKKNTEVVVLDRSNSRWYEITVPDGTHGYMSAQYLTYVRVDHVQVVEEYKPLDTTVLEPHQLRNQPFRIYRVVPDLDKVTVYARHIFYDLLDNMIKSYKPKTTTLGKNVVAGIAANCLSEHSFTFYSDLNDPLEDVEYAEDQDTLDFVNINPVEALLGDEGVTHYYGGEMARDWYDVFLVERIGMDSGMQIREGKNLLGITYDVDETDVITRIMPTGEDKDGELLYHPNVYFDSPFINEYPSPKWYHLAVSDCKESKEKTKQQCYDQMADAAQKEFDKECDLPNITIKIDFISCPDTEEYAQYNFLQNVFIGDSVDVYTKRLGIAVKMRMTEYTYDCLTRKYTKMTLGKIEESIEASSISAAQIPSGAITGGKLAMHAVGSMQMKDASITSAKIAHAAIQQAHIQEAAIAYANIAKACIDQLGVNALDVLKAKITSLDAESVMVDELGAELARIQTVIAGVAEFDRAVVKNLVSKSLHLEYGVGEQVFISNLAVGYAQMVGATIGELCLKATSGDYYILDIDDAGCVTATKRTVTESEKAEGKTTDGKALVETTMTAEQMNTSSLFATFALVNRIDAAIIDTDTFFARQGFVNKLWTNTISSTGKTLDFVADTAEMALSDYESLSIGGRNLLLSTSEGLELTSSVSDFYKFTDYARSLEGTSIPLYISFEAKASQALYCDWYYRNDAEKSVGANDTTDAFHLTTEWAKYSCKAKNYDLSDKVNLRLRKGVNPHSASSTGTLWIRNLKFEVGTKPTDYTRAPEDVAEDIDEALGTASEALEQLQTYRTVTSVEADGVHVRSARSEDGQVIIDPTGSNVHIGSARMAINIPSYPGTDADKDRSIITANVAVQGNLVIYEQAGCICFRTRDEGEVFT